MLLFHVPWASGQTDPRYSVIDLTPLHEFDQLFLLNVDDYGSMGINNHGEVVYGRFVEGDVLHPWVWLPESLSAALPVGLTDLFTLAGENGIARDINEDHQIAGQRGEGRYLTEGDEAGIWDLEAAAQGYFFPLGTLDAIANDWSGANAINNDNPPIVVGQAAERFSHCTPCPLPPGAQLVEELSKHLGFKATFAGNPLPALSVLGPSGAHDFNSSYAMGVSTAAQSGSVKIAGGSLCTVKGTQCVDPNLPACHPVLEATHWQSSSGSNLAVIHSNVDASGRRMSDDGHVAGWGKDLTQPPVGDPTCIRHALYWQSPTSAYTDLRQYLPAGQAGHACRAEGVNNGTSPAVVGWDEEAADGMLWERQSNGTWLATNLNSSAAIGGASTRWDIREAHDINDNGWIAAIAIDISAGSPAVYHAVLLAPYVPCPGDVNYDGVVNVDDLLTVILDWGPCPAPPALCPANIVNTGTSANTVDVDDLVAVILGWGLCPSVTTAEASAPVDVEGCYEQSLAAYPDTSSPKFIETYDACIESLCRRGLLNCD